LIDAELSLDAINTNLYEDVNKLAPFGIGNRKPIFLFKDIQASEVRLFGKAEEHVDLVFPKQNGQKISAISFFGAHNSWVKDIQGKKKLDLLASLEKSMFRNRPELRLRIVEVYPL
jgi:single-stranded-DNA-specific exonuclease